ncbi:MAG: hypothetical protein DRP80_06065 [Candidatus Omnitrophota bacterium]|nr:MAG: hypothetical protein DRP80_06065 [Candidatus Omnitrophota bacterium]
MIVSVHQPQYLPWIGYFDKILKSDCFVFLDKVQYKHREFQNRNRIRVKDGWIWLTVPVIVKGKRHQLINEVKIDNTSEWQRGHLRSLEVSYSKAEFFKDYRDWLEEVYLNRKWEKLIDLNVFIIRFILNELKIETPVYFESELGTTHTGTERIIEICKKLGADTYLSGVGGRDYLDEERFKEEGIVLKYQEFKHPIYRQVFCRDEKEFVPNLSVIDLLFNEGQESKVILIGGYRR